MVMNNDECVKKAYSLMATNEHEWSRYAEQEIDSLLNYIIFQPPRKIIDIGCGTGRHSLILAKKGFDVRGYDYTQANIDKANEGKLNIADQINISNSSLSFELMDARDPEPIEAAPLVLCIYDVIGSSEYKEDAIKIINGLFRLCSPGGKVIIGCINGINLMKNIEKIKIIHREPTNNDLVPVNTMQNNGEIFDYEKMVYNPINGVLYRREIFYGSNKEIIFDSIIKEHRYIPAEIHEMMKQAGFYDVQIIPVHAGNWIFGSENKMDAPEFLYIGIKPENAFESIPRMSQLESLPEEYKGYTLEIIPNDQISYQHVNIVSRIFSTSFGINPKTGKMHVLGPKKMWGRLKKSSYLCICAVGKQPVGYMFGTEYLKLKKIAWLDSLCVMDKYRRRGLATVMLNAFARLVPEFEYLGATTPNPVTKIVMDKLHLGIVYGPWNPAPESVYELLDYIQTECEDIKNCSIDKRNMIIKTNFTIAMESWRGGTPQPPPWWAQLQNIPEDHESLVIIQRNKISV